MGDHWYQQSGQPFYRITGANGKERDVTLADARKVGAVASVTTVLDILAKPALTNWMVDQGILAALTLPRLTDEPEGDFLARVKADSREQAKKAAETGTAIHDACESHFKARVVEHRYREHVAGVAAEVARLFPGVDDWVSEAYFAHPLGFGGKVDLHSPSTGIVIDFKGKDGDFSDGKRLAYDQHFQLAAYQRGLNLAPNVCANVFFSRSHPGAVTSHVWKAEDIEHGWQLFQCTLAVWKCLKKYNAGF